MTKPWLPILCMSSFVLSNAGEKTVSLFTAIDVGRVQSGSDMSAQITKSDGTALNRTYVDVGFTDKVDEHNRLSVGVGGIFWNAYAPGGGGPDNRVIKFGPGISQALLEWTPSTSLSLTFGYFAYKYNESAKNLGEYMFRTEAYPTIIYTDGWSLMNDVQYHPVGMKLTYINESGTFKQDLGIFIEYFNSPIYDITPAYIATYKPMDAITLGGGMALHRLISPTPGTKSKLTEKREYYKDFYIPPAPASRKYDVAIPNYVGETSHKVTYAAGGTPDTIALKNAIFASEGSTLAIYNVTSADQIPLRLDTSAGAIENGKPEEYVTKLKADIAPEAFDDPKNAGKNAQTVSFDLAAIYLDVFFTLDFNALLGMDAKQTGTFKFYGEIAQLGLKNYPIFYTKYAQRMPIMLGISIPTFRAFDDLSIETEYLNNPTIESIFSTYSELDLAPDGNYRYKTFNQDNLKWSIHGSRALSNFLSLYVQVANDHMRLKDGFTQPQLVPMTNQKKDWYWLMRIQWAI